ncbi:hypothetical protein Pcinc_006849 [Petrolisthes cinctipes]|uniref:Uncharacterized protein n=1 Tax=Petrolisthes cinctipes TaxID=88211 RepID=A0AAE1EUR2_PETCI|nr:hypothetical protein Pcinc_032301 [Petrolisthes cinctipes]KAK3889106.1 hypothetical protein Pcinc_006849 [Petrolisthes cinctipes]
MPVEVYSYMQKTGRQVMWYCQNCQNSCCEVYNKIKKLESQNEAIKAKQVDLEAKIQQVENVVVEEQRRGMEVSNRIEAIGAINQDFFNNFEEIKARLEVLEGRAVNVDSSGKMLEAVESVVESKLKEKQEELHKSVN